MNEYFLTIFSGRECHNKVLKYTNLLRYLPFHRVYKSGCLELGNFPPTEAFTARLTLCAGVTKVETFAEKLERLDAEAAEKVND